MLVFPGDGECSIDLEMAATMQLQKHVIMSKYRPSLIRYPGVPRKIENTDFI